MDKKTNPFSRSLPHKLFQPTSNDKYYKKDMAGKLENGDVVCCCTLERCGACQDVLLIGMPPGGAEYIRSKAMISVKKTGALKKEHYVDDAKLYLAIHHFSCDFIDVQEDGLQVILKGGADPSAATSTSKTDTKAWREAFEAKCAEAAQQRGPALVQLANVAANAQQAAERDVARLRADLDLARTAPYVVTLSAYFCRNLFLFSSLLAFVSTFEAGASPSNTKTGLRPQLRHVWRSSRQT